MLCILVLSDIKNHYIDIAMLMTSSYIVENEGDNKTG